MENIWFKMTNWKQACIFTTSCKMTIKLYMYWLGADITWRISTELWKVKNEKIHGQVEWSRRGNLNKKWAVCITTHHPNTLQWVIPNILKDSSRGGDESTRISLNSIQGTEIFSISSSPVFIFHRLVNTRH